MEPPHKVQRIDMAEHWDHLESLYEQHRNLAIKSHQTRHTHSLSQQKDLLNQNMVLERNIMALLSRIMALLNQHHHTRAFTVHDKHITLLLDLLFDGPHHHFSSILLVNIIVQCFRTKHTYNIAILVQRFLMLNFQSECVAHQRLSRRQTNRVHTDIFALSLLNRLIVLPSLNFIEYADVFLQVSSDILQIHVQSPHQHSSVLAHEVLQFVHSLVKLLVHATNTMTTSGANISTTSAFQASPTSFFQSTHSSHGAPCQSTLSNTDIYQQRPLYNLNRRITPHTHHSPPQTHNAPPHHVPLHNTEHLLPNIIKKAFCLKEPHLQKMSLKICRCIFKHVPPRSNLALLCITCIHQLLAEHDQLLHFEGPCADEHSSEKDVPLIEVSPNMLSRYRWKLLLQSVIHMFKGFSPPTPQSNTGTPISPPRTFRHSSTSQHTRTHEKLIKSFVSLIESIYSQMEKNGCGERIGVQRGNVHECNKDTMMIDDESPAGHPRVGKGTFSRDFFSVFFHVFGCHDSDMIQVLLYLLELYVFLFRENSHILEQIRPYLHELPFITNKHQEEYFVEEWRLFLNPHQFFYHFLEFVRHRCDVLLEFLVSNETQFLQYLLMYCKFRRGDHDGSTTRSHAPNTRSHGSHQRTPPPTDNSQGTSTNHHQESIEHTLHTLKLDIHSLGEDTPFNMNALLRCLPGT